MSNLTGTDLSTVGAFNVTGLSLIAPYNVPDQIYIFYQHYSGELRYSGLTDSGWHHGGSAEIAVSSSVKNGTPITGCSGEPGDVIYARNSQALANQTERLNLSNTSPTSSHRYIRDLARSLPGQQQHR